MEGLCSLLFKRRWYFINRHAGQKMFNRCFGTSLLLLEFSCFRNVLPYHLRMFRVYTRKYYVLSKIICLVLFCSEKEHIIKYKITGTAAHCSLFSNQLLVIFLKANKIFS